MKDSPTSHQDSLKSLLATIPEKFHPFLTRPDLLRGEIAEREREVERVETERNAEGVRIRCRGSLAAFVRAAWHVLEPATPLIWNWHLDAICLHLEAVTRKEINRLLINIPPGTMKSLMTSVFWPAWEWGPAGMAHLRYVSTSYNERFVTRDTRRMRDLIESPWYRLHWPHVILKRRGETSFENTANGFREGYMFTSLTGGRGNRVIIDDPHSTEGAESDADRERVVRIFLESVPSRVNDIATDAIIVDMQRLHERDVSGIILTKDLGYVHLCMPMEFEHNHPYAHATPIWHDPRSIDGELLFPAKFPAAEVAQLKTSLGSFGTAGQLQQRPAPRGGGMFKRAWFEGKVIAEIPEGRIEWTHAWDLAATQKKQGNNPSFTARVRMGRLSDGRFIISNVRRFQESAGVVATAIKADAESLRGTGGRIRLPQDPGQAGKAQSESILKMLAGLDVVIEPVTGEKEIRARPFAVSCEAGNVYLVAGDWVEPFLDEICSFPNAAHDDQVDAASDAHNDLANRSRYSLDNL